MALRAIVDPQPLWVCWGWLGPWQHGNWTPPSACLCFPSLFSRCCYQGNSVIYILHVKLSQNGLPGELNHYGQETDLPPQKSCRVFPVAVLVADKGDTQRGAREVLSADFQWLRKSPQEKEMGMTCSPSRKCPFPGTTLPRLKKNWLYHLLVWLRGKLLNLSVPQFPY